MPNLTVITDNSGNVVGAVRSDPVQTDLGELQFVAPKTNKNAYREIEVPDERLSSAPDRLLAQVADLIQSK